MTQTQKDYCLGCGEIKTVGRKTSGGMFYCNSCWKAAYHAQQQYHDKPNTARKNKTFVTSNNGLYSHNKYAEEYFKSARLNQSHKASDNKLMELMQAITNLNEENVSLRSQVDIILKNNERLMEENKLLNNLDDGIGKYDYVQLKLENERLMEDAETLSLNVKKVMFELNNMKHENDEQSHEIKSLQSQIEHERKMRALAEDTLSAKREHYRFRTQEKDELRKQGVQRAKSVQNQYKATVSKYRKRYNTKKSISLHERGSNDSSFTKTTTRDCDGYLLTPRRRRRRIINVISSKSSLAASGFRDLTLQPPITQTHSVPLTVPTAADLTKKKSLPKNIGMVLI